VVGESDDMALKDDADVNKLENVAHRHEAMDVADNVECDRR
jgi:hypothetical protein